MKKKGLIFFFLLCIFSARAQELSILNQDFRGVKTLKYYSTVTDSSGKVRTKKTFVSEYFFDSLGRKTRIAHYEKGINNRSDYYFYDSLGRFSMYIEWTKKDGNRKYIYTYETDSSGRFTIAKVHHNKTITRTESSYWDTLQGERIVSTWYGELTYGPPSAQQEFDKFGKLVMEKSYNGFTEYRYDSLGNMNYMLIRQFEDGHCASYMPFDYENLYSQGRLCQFSSKSSVTWLTYNERGLISQERSRTRSSDWIFIEEAEYIYYKP